eukprot:EG_transcript_7150
MANRRGVPSIKPESRPGFVKETGPEERVRYWPGKAPKAAPQEGSDGEEDQLTTPFVKPEPRPARPLTRDPRLERLRRTRRRREEEDDDDIDAARRRRRRVAEAEELQPEDIDERKLVAERMKMERLMATEQSAAVSYEDEDEEEIALRRELLRERKLAQRHAAEEEVLPRVEAEEDEADDESGGEYVEMTDEEEEYVDQAMAKPVFVRSSDRITVKEREKLAEEEKERREREEQRKASRKQETHKLVVEVVKREIEQIQNAVGDSDEEMPSDDDEANEAEEYERWKVREIHRIKAYREEREKWQKEKDEILRRRGLTDEQRRREDEAIERANRKEEVKWKFLQKYYHKGAYFMDTVEKGKTREAIYDRDYGHATGEDKFDKTTMPQVMQVKNFGKMGRTKWTHLVKEDTTAKATEDVFTTGTAGAAVAGSAHYAHNMTYNNQHFTYAFAKQDAIGSAKYGAAKVAKESLLERPAARRRNQK